MTRERPPNHPMFPEARGPREMDPKKREARIAEFKARTQGLSGLIEARLKERDRAGDRRSRVDIQRALRREVISFLEDRGYVLTNVLEETPPGSGFEVVLKDGDRSLTIRLYSQGAYVEIDSETL